MKDFCAVVSSTSDTAPFEKIKLFFDAIDRRLSYLSADITRAGKGFADAFCVE